jgi:hypothetical protein
MKLSILSLLSFWRCIVLFFLVGILYSWAGPFPGDLPGTEIGDSLPLNYEPSGAVWHKRLQKLFTVWDNGMVTMMDFDGTGVTNWSVAGDLEGICIADTGSAFVYVGLERPEDGVEEFNIATGQVTRFFNLTPWLQSSDPNSGLEALTFVPDTLNPEGGLFYAGLQENGKVYIFELPIKTSSTDTTVKAIDTIIPDPLYAGISGLHYDTGNSVLYAIWSSVRKIRAMKRDGTTIVEWDLPGDTQEGIALWEGTIPGNGQIFIAEDAGEIWRYGFNSEIDIVINGSGSVDVTPNPPSYYGSSTILTAIPDSGYYFVEWGGELAGTANPETLLMDYDKNVTANFAPAAITEDRYPLPVDRRLVLCISPNPSRGRVNIEWGAGNNSADVILGIYDVFGFNHPGKGRRVFVLGWSG